MRRPPEWKTKDVISASKLRLMSDAIRELQNLIRPNVTKKGGRGGSGLCSFGKVINGATTGKQTMNAGQIHAGGTHTAKGGENGPDLTPADGHFIWAEVTIAATVDSGALTGAWTASGAELASGETVPDDHEWTESSASGKAYAPLGYWTETGPSSGVFNFTGYACGDVTFKFCVINTGAGTAQFYRG